MGFLLPIHLTVIEADSSLRWDPPGSGDTFFPTTTKTMQVAPWSIEHDRMQKKIGVKTRD